MGWGPDTGGTRLWGSVGQKAWEWVEAVGGGRSADGGGDGCAYVGEVERAVCELGEVGRAKAAGSPVQECCCGLPGREQTG